jgi:divalent metal cation (Fe/Co/Zn/Cd) transporter
MCVIIVIVKVFVYIKSGAAVVRTSALDSCGDLVANTITLYTGYRMSSVDLKQYPVGQAKFEPIGVTVFATLMASAMFANALGNFEDLMSEAEKERDEAVGDFYDALFGTHVESEGEKHEFNDPEVGFAALRAVVSPDNRTKISEFFTKILASEDFPTSKAAAEETMNWAAEVEDPELQWPTLMFQNGFLGCCGLYKCCLWLYCLLYAIPATGSCVLVALANDKRNDFIACSFVVTTSFLAYALNDWLNEVWDADKIDPLSSLILSSVIVYTWVSLLGEQVTVLSQRSADADVLEPIRDVVRDTIRGTSCDVDGSDVKAYFSSYKYTVEVDLTVINRETPYSEVYATTSKLKQKILELDDMERALIIPRVAV